MCVCTEGLPALLYFGVHPFPKVLLSKLTGTAVLSLVSSDGIRFDQKSSFLRTADSSTAVPGTFHSKNKPLIPPANFSPTAEYVSNIMVYKAVCLRCSNHCRTRSTFTFRDAPRCRFFEIRVLFFMDFCEVWVSTLSPSLSLCPFSLFVECSTSAAAFTVVLQWKPSIFLTSKEQTPSVPFHPSNIPFIQRHRRQVAGFGTERGARER